MRSLAGRMAPWIAGLGIVILSWFVSSILLSVGVWESGGPDVAALAGTLAQVLATFVSILIVFVVFKLTFLFEQIERQEEEMPNVVPDVRVIREAEARYGRLVARKAHYVRPLQAPVVAMTAALIGCFLGLLFAGPLRDHPTWAVRSAVLLTLSASASVIWGAWQAFGVAIER